MIPVEWQKGGQTEDASHPRSGCFDPGQAADWSLSFLFLGRFPPVLGNHLDKRMETQYNDSCKGSGQISARKEKNGLAEL